ncbi:MAG: hypothetical protein K2I14_05060 [Eubacterium sp.]|nr:hypothetical protein [Eubacterium sp.]
MAKNPNRAIVNTSNLTENMRVASYSQMCSLIGCDFVKCGPARINQIDNWKRYFDFTTSGHAYIISKVYDSPLPSKKEIKRQERQSIIDEEKAKKLQWHEECRIRREEQEASRQRRKIQKAEREEQKAIKAQQREKRRQQKLIEEQEKEERKIAREERKVAIANKIDGRTHRNGKYISAIEPLLLDSLHKNNNTLQIIPKDVFLLLGMVNSNLVKEGINKKTSTTYLIQKLNEKIYKSNPDLFVSTESVGLTPQILNNFMQQSIIKVNQILRAALDSMVKRNLITYKTERILVRNSGDENVASLSEADRIENAEKAVLNKMGFDSIGRVYARNKRKDFYYNVQRYLKSNEDRNEDTEFYDDWEWDRFFSRLSITLNTEEGKLHNLLPSTQNDTFSCAELREQLNSQVIEFMISKAKKVYNDFKVKCEQITLRGERIEDSSYFNKYPENYVEIVSFLADYFLNINYKEEEEVSTEQDSVVCESEFRIHNNTPTETAERDFVENEDYFKISLSEIRTAISDTVNKNTENTTLSSESPEHRSFTLSKHKYTVYKKGEKDSTMNNLKLITTESFENGVAEHGIPCDFWKDINDEYYITREQIGRALNYDEPNKSIDKIHSRHKDRLNKFSTTVNLGVVEGNRYVERERTLYSRKGVMEICRWSRQPIADKFMDWVWDVIDGLIKNNMQNTQSNISNDIRAETIKQIQMYANRTPWKREVTRKIKTLAYLTSYGNSEETRPIYAHIYTTMCSEGYDINDYKEKYLDMHPDITSPIFGIDVIEAFDELKNAFEKILEEYLLHELKIKNKVTD